MSLCDVGSLAGTLVENCHPEERGNRSIEELAAPLTKGGFLGVRKLEDGT
jgi:hypothetical protein